MQTNLTLSAIKKPHPFGWGFFLCARVLDPLTALIAMDLAVIPFLSCFLYS